MLKYLIEKEFKQILRDKFLPKIIFVLPILQLLILPLAANFEMKNINLAVVDHNRSESSRVLINKIISSNYFNLTEYFNSYAEALESIENNSSDIILEIPTDMEQSAIREGKATVLISANAVNGTKGGLGSAYLTSILTDSYNIEGVPVTYLNNPHLSYRYFMVPGIIAFLVTLIGGFVSAPNIVQEKERGTIEQINVSPLPKYLFILSKLIPFWIIGIIVLTISLIIAWAVYGMVPVGSYVTIYLFAAIYLLFCTGLGLAISAISNTQQQAMFTAFFFIIVIALMSGLFTPINSMPKWAQHLTIFNPMRYFVELLRMVYLKGSPLSSFSMHFLAIGLMAAAINCLAIVGYKK